MSKKGGVIFNRVVISTFLDNRGVSNHWQLGCSFRNSIRLIPKKTWTALQWRTSVTGLQLVIVVHKDHKLCDPAQRCLAVCREKNINGNKRKVCGCRLSHVWGRFCSHQSSEVKVWISNLIAYFYMIMRPCPNTNITTGAPFTNTF